MHSTSTSLLDLLKNGGDQDESWRRMVELYRPLIEKWLMRFGAPTHEVDDLSQTVLAIVFEKLPSFEHAGRIGSFRAWLRTITRNCLLKFWKKNQLTPTATGKSSFQESLNQLADEQSELSQQWNREYDEFILAAVLKQIKNEFEPKTWKMFKMVAMDGIGASDVANQLNVSLNSVFIAKSRVMNRLRIAGKHLIDD